MMTVNLLLILIKYSCLVYIRACSLAEIAGVDIARLENDGGHGRETVQYPPSMSTPAVS